MWGSTRREFIDAITRAQADATSANNAVASALGRLERHEGVCAERQGNIIRNMESISASLKKLWGYLITGGLALIGGMAWLIVDLALRGKIIP